MTKEIAETLGALVGLPLWKIGRVLDLAMFEFGNRRTRMSRKGVEVEVGDYALHVQCAWRITQGDKVVTGRGDIFCTPEETAEPIPADFNWEKSNRFDRRIKHLLDNESSKFIVQSVHVGDAGSFTLALSGGFKLDVFPQDSETGEHWRFFESDSEKNHFVVRGDGLEN